MAAMGCCPPASAQGASGTASTAAAAPQTPGVGSPAQVNRYGLEPFHADFPVAIAYPAPTGLDYDRTRRQILARLADNLQGNGSRETWLVATEFFWRAPEDAVEPLVETMDRTFGNPALKDVVKNCVEAMGKMANEEFDVPLQRALEHPDPNVRQAAFASLATSGKEATLRKMAAWFDQMDGRSRTTWLRSLRLRLGSKATPFLKHLMMADYQSSVRDLVLRETVQLPVADAAEVLRGRWPDAVGEFKAIIAGVLHAAGDTAGTVWLRDALQSEDVGTLALAIRYSVFGDPGVLRESLLRASTHLRPEIRLEAARALTKVEGEDVADIYEVMLAPDEVWEVRSIAVRELTRRNRPRAITMMLEELETATGTRVQLLLSQLAASSDPRAVAVFLERFRRAPPGEGRPFLQSIAQNQSQAAVAALFEVFEGPEVVVGHGQANDYTSLNYIPTLLLNVRGHERDIVAAFEKIPRQDWRRRALLLSTLSGIAADREDAELRVVCLAPLRTMLFDREEEPQLRVLALNQLVRRWLTIDEVLRLKNMRSQEKPGMRSLLNDFLNEYF